MFKKNYTGSIVLVSSSQVNQIFVFNVYIREAPSDSIHHFSLTLAEQIKTGNTYTTMIVFKNIRNNNSSGKKGKCCQMFSPHSYACP